MIVTSLLLLIGLTAAAPANDSSSVLSITDVWREGRYNASGNFTLLTHPLNLGNALYSEPMVNWTVEERIAAAPGSSSTWTYFGVRPVEALPANILPGWSLCVTLIPTKRTSSDPVDGTCKGIVSDECINSLKAGSSRCNSGATLKGCPAGGSYSFLTPLQANATGVDVLDGWRPGMSVGNAPGKSQIQQYDEYVQTNYIVTLAFGSNSSFGAANVGCMGISEVKDGSRGLKDALSTSSSARLGLPFVLAAVVALLVL